jgi:hypothetical protein
VGVILLKADMLEHIIMDQMEPLPNLLVVAVVMVEQVELLLVVV